VHYAPTDAQIDALCDLLVEVALPQVWPLWREISSEPDLQDPDLDIQSPGAA
jgi:hypothetical protein